jgi:hypothetical protein
MNKNILIGLVVILAVAGGYYQFSIKPAQEAAAAAAMAADEAAAAAAKAAEDAAAEAAAKAVEEQAAAAALAEQEAAAAAEAAAPAVTEATGDAAAAVTEAVSDMTTLLDPANFDAAKIGMMIDASSLDDTTKSALKASAEAAGTDPAAIQAVIGSVKAALGL